MYLDLIFSIQDLLLKFLVHNYKSYLFHEFKLNLEKKAFQLFLKEFFLNARRICFLIILHFRKNRNSKKLRAYLSSYYFHLFLEHIVSKVQLLILFLQTSINKLLIKDLVHCQELFLIYLKLFLMLFLFI